MNKEMAQEQNGFEKSLAALLPQYKVDGFDPNDLLVKVETVDEDGMPADFLYLECQASIQWFLTVFPNGCFDFKYDAVNDERAVVTALVYRNPDDARFASKATAVRSFSDTPHGRNFRQNAETAAIRKALERLGFGIPLNAHETESTRVVSGRDTGFSQEVNESSVLLPRPVVQIPDNASATEKEQKHVEEPEKTDMDAAETPAAETPSTDKENPQKEETKPNHRRGRPKKAQSQQVDEQSTEPQAEVKEEEEGAEPAKSENSESAGADTEPAKREEQKPDNKASEEGEKRSIPLPVNPTGQTTSKVPTFEEARDFKIPFGSYQGKTLQEAVDESPKGLELIAMYERYARRGSDFEKALAVFKSQMLA